MTMTRLGAGQLAVHFLVEVRFSAMSGLAQGPTQPPSMGMWDVGALSSGKGNKAHQTLQVKKEWSSASTPSICLHGTYISG